VPNTELGYTVQQKHPVLDIEQSNPVRVTIENHGMSKGQFVRVTNIFNSPPQHDTGMYEIKNQIYQIGNVTTDTFDLFDQEGYPVDGTQYTAYIPNPLTQFTLTGPDLNTQNLNTQEDE
jgi:hypothetical protein